VVVPGDGLIVTHIFEVPVEPCPLMSGFTFEAAESTDLDMTFRTQRVLMDQ
jgi:hypothetical protein